MHEPPMIAVEDLSCELGGTTIFDAVAFELASGTCGVVTGDNGAGKSTLLKVVAGLLEPRSGQVDLRPEMERSLHYLAADAPVKADETVAQQLDLACAVLDVAERDDVLALVGIAHARDLPGRALSTGQRRRFAMARLLLAERPLWVLDEPVSGLDAAGRALFGELLRDHLEAGGVALVASHDELAVPAASLRRLDLSRGAA